MTTLKAVVQPTEPPHIRVTAQDIEVATGANRLVNGSFETPDLGGTAAAYAPAAWSLIQSRATARQGPNSLDIFAPSDGARWLSLTSLAAGDGLLVHQSVNAAAGELLRVSARVQATSGVTVTLALTPFNGPNILSGTVRVSVVGGWGEWQTITGTITMPATTTLLRVGVEVTGSVAGSVIGVDAVTAGTALAPVNDVSLFRVVNGQRLPVRGAQRRATSGGVLVITDHEAPFATDFHYVLTQALSNGTTAETLSETVRMTTALPWISHPITGQGVTATITDWPELTYSARQNVVAVAGRSRPIVISDRRIAASSELVILTKTRAALLDLRALLASGDPLLVRPVCDAVEGDYLAIGDVSEARVKPKGEGAGSDWRRLVSMDAQVVDAPDTSIPAIGDTLASLAAYVPTTLAALADAFGPGATLLTIAETSLATG